MPISVLVSLCGFGATLVVLLVGCGVAWGSLTTRLAGEKDAREKDVTRLEKEIEKCRTDAKESLSRAGGIDQERLSRVTGDVDGLQVAIDRGFAELRGVLSAITNQLTKHDAQRESLQEKIEKLERKISQSHMPAQRGGPAGPGPGRYPREGE